MEFLKKHYEKIILTVFLILFVVSLFYLINVIREVQGKSVDTLQLPKVSPDYKPIDFAIEKYQPLQLFKKSGVWNQRQKLVKTDKVFTDLVVPFDISKCPHCQRYVPRYYFVNDPHKCPFCSGELPDPPVIKVNQNTGIDTDGDGISDADEDKYKLNKNDPKDAALDNDGDGFPNFFEIEKQTNPNDPKSHPPLCLRLYVVKVYQTRLGVMLKKLQVRGENRNEWDIQLDVWQRGWRTKFMKLNDTVKIGSQEFKIIDCKPKRETQFDKKTKTDVEKDMSEVTIQSVKGDEKIVMVVDQNVYSPKEKVYLRDVSSNMGYKLEIDSVFKAGSELTGTEQYKVISIDAKNSEIQVVNLKDNQIYGISGKKRFEYVSGGADGAPGNNRNRFSRR